MSQPQVVRLWDKPPVAYYVSWAVTTNLAVFTEAVVSQIGYAQFNAIVLCIDRF